MPNNEEHARHSYDRYGLHAEDLHRWMDEPHKLYGSSHRWVRHQNDDVKNPPKWAIDKYGLERTRDVMMDHILLDRDTTERGRVERERAYEYTVNIDTEAQRARAKPSYPSPSDKTIKWFILWLGYSLGFFLIMENYWLPDVLVGAYFAGWFILVGIAGYYALTEKLKCPKCGHKMKYEYPYCTSCGEKIQYDKPEPPPRIPRPRERPSGRGAWVRGNGFWMMTDENDHDEEVEDFLILELTEEDEG